MVRVSIALSIIVGAGTGIVSLSQVLGLALVLSFIGCGIGIVVPPHKQMLMGLGLRGMSSIIMVRPWCCHGMLWL